MRDKLQVKSPDAIGWINLLIYGEPGAGKTWLTGTAQDHDKTGPILLLDVEGGTVTLRDRKDIDVKQVRSISDIVEIHRTLVEENNNYYKTVIIDSLTELQKLDMRDIMKEVVNKRPDLDPDVPSMREWGKSSEHIRRIVRGFRDLEMNTIMTALMQVEKDEVGVVTYYPALPGKLRAEIPGFLDIVGYLYTVVEDDETIRKIQFAKTRRITAKDRTSALGDSMSNPTVPMIWDLIHSKTNAK